MLLALGVLLLALFAVVIKNWDFWFPPRTDAQDAPYTPSATGNANTANASSRPAHARHQAKPAPIPKVEAAPPPPMTAQAERRSLPPMSVEVVAGSHHTVLPARNNAINLDLSAGSAPANPAPSSAVVSAADRVQLSEQTTQTVVKSVPPDYPMLARQMKVQGAVILQALISREGTIQELEVLSGPSILAAAAREAVRQWRFKPYYQNGEAVETQAKITVNFTISTN